MGLGVTVGSRLRAVKHQNSAMEYYAPSLQLRTACSYGCHTLSRKASCLFYGLPIVDAAAHPALSGSCTGEPSSQSLRDQEGNLYDFEDGVSCMYRPLAMPAALKDEKVSWAGAAGACSRAAMGTAIRQHETMLLDGPN